MSHKKYYGYKKPRESYSIRFHDSAENGRVDVGSMFTIGYQNEKFYMVKMSRGTEEGYERSRVGEVEMNWYFDEGIPRS